MSTPGSYAQYKEVQTTDIRRKVEAARRKLADAYDSATSDYVRGKLIQ